MKRSLFLAALVACATAMADTTLDPDVVLYYDFETMGSDPNKVANIANPGTMDLAGGGNWENASYPVEATPAATLRQARLAATSEDSAKALRSTWSSGDQNAYRYFLPSENWFSTTNFTVEFFYKMDGNIAAFTPLFRRTGANNVQINIGVGETANKLTATLMTGEVSGSYATVSVNDDAATGDGKWHHAALVVSQTGSTKTMRFYRDYKLKGSQSLAANVTAANTANVSVTLAGRADGNCFNGWMDSVRVTLRALEPQEFLWGEGMDIGRFPAGSTLAHVKFDDSINAADPDGGTFLNGANVAAMDGGSAATFSDDVPGARIVDGEDGAIISRNNKKSLSFANSKVTWSTSDDTYYLRKTLTDDQLTAFTVEFFFKPNGTQSTWSRLVSGLSGNNFSSGYAYALTFYASNKLSLRGDSKSYGYSDLDCPTDVCDGKWHHAAITVAPNTGDSTKSDVTFHLDYGTENGGWTGTATSTKALVTHPSDLYFVLGTGNNGNGYNGLIDELRISDCALEPSQFLRAENAPGLTIIFR